MPKVSVIIPCYNQGIFVNEAVDSVLNQTFQDFEIIIVNDGSNDQYTNELLASYNRPKTRVITTTNQRLAQARNNGIKEAKGEYVLPLDADDKIGPNYLEKAVKILDSDSSIGIVYCEAEFFGAASGKWNLPEYKFPEILGGNLIFCSSFFRKSDWLEVGGYNPNMTFCWEDWDFWLSLIEIGVKVYRIPEICFFYRRTSASMISSVSSEKMFYMALQVFENHKQFFKKNISYFMKLLEHLGSKFIISNIFYDTGYGFNENEMFYCYSTDSTFSYKIDFNDISQNIRSIRFDPIGENWGKILFKKIVFFTNNGECVDFSLEKIITNCHLDEENWFNFKTGDPYFIFDDINKYTSLQIEGNINLNSFSQNEIEYYKVVDSNENLKTQLVSTQAQLDWTMNKYLTAADQLNLIYNSKSWKMITLFKNYVVKYKLMFIYRYIIKFLRLPKKIIKIFYHRVKNSHGYNLWIRKNEPLKMELKEQSNFDFSIKPKISLIVPTYNTPERYLKEMIESVLSQTYVNWELCIADGSSKKSYIEDILQSYASKDSRVKYKILENNNGIVGNSNEAISLATGEYIGLLDHDDTIAPFALYEVVKAINENPGTDFIYSDEDKINESGSMRFMPHFKSDFNLELFRCYNYICHFTVIKKDLGDKLGWFREGYEGSQDYDLFLRAVERAFSVKHIAKILYHWRANPNSTASDTGNKTYAIDSAKKALAEHLERMDLKGIVLDGIVPTLYRIEYALIDRQKVSIIIPNHNNVETLKLCIDSIREKSSYENYEIIIVENNSTEKELFAYYENLKNDSKIKIINWDKPFNYAAVNNFAVNHASGEILLFLNNDMEVINKDWLEQMLQYIQRPEVGVVGAKLYYPDNTIQHAGVILGIGGVAGHSHKGLKRESFGYFGRAALSQEFNAVTGACLMIKKEIFQTLRGFDERYVLAFNDIDLCLRVREMNYKVIFSPFAELYHYESKTRGYEDTPEKVKRFEREKAIFFSKWESLLNKGDIYYNPNLTLKNEFFEINI